MTNSINVTESASTYIGKKILSQPGHVFRLTIKKTGCSGYSYVPEIVQEARATDTMLEVTPDVSIYLDTTWMHLLEGITMDYIEEEKMGLKQKRLVFINPKEASRCGCGESFHVS